VPIADVGEAALEDYVRRVTKAESRRGKAGRG